MIFDILCYAMAIAATLAFVGSNRPNRSIHTTLDTLHAIGEALPDDCFAIDTEGSVIPDIDRLNDEPEQHEPVEDFSDLLAISTPQGIDTRWLATYGTHALRTLGVIEGITGARHWAKGKAIATLTAHYAMA